MSSRPRAVRDRLRAGFGLMALVLVTCGLVGLVALGRVREALLTTVRQSADMGDRLSRTRDATARFVTLAQSELLANRDDRRLDTLGVSADSARESLVRSASLGATERASVQRLGALQGGLEVRFAVARAYRDIGRPADAATQAALSAAMLDTLFAETDAIAHSEQLRTRDTVAHVESLVGWWRAALLALLIAGTALAVVFARSTTQAITAPLGALAGAARTFGDGDLRVAIDADGLDTEYRGLAVAFSEMAVRLRTMIAEVQGEAEQVATAAGSLTQASEQAALSTGEISATVQRIADGATAQQAGLSESAAAIHRVTDAAAAISDTAVRSRAVGDAVRAGAVQIRAGLTDALATVERARALIGGSGAQVEQLRETAEAVGQFVTRVQEIASQSNLLALNAAIEAARAGEHGRGFAVVATEVRSLAVESASAAGEVTAIMRGMRDAFVDAAATTARGVRELGDVGDVSRKAAAALDAIDGAVAGTEQVAVAASAAADDSRAAAEMVEQQVRASAGQADVQGAMSEAAAVSAEETAATTEEVAATAQSLAASALRLQTIVGRFSV
ncbi:MAG TPA: methyl-accepting chemotaxis protein [Gemmatimonadaceae bacterium]|nr:methyl-accepting chemotaxis protein [Gemmatimonadaceae bacterium]